jgi:hypothetical protein
VGHSQDAGHYYAYVKVGQCGPVKFVGIIATAVFMGKLLGHRVLTRFSLAFSQGIGGQ